MNPINLQVQFIDGSTADCVAIATDLIAFESHFDLSVARLEKEIRLTHLFFLACQPALQQPLHAHGL